MNRLMMFTGGTRSGKSEAAERWANARAAACSGTPVVYIATAEALDEEMRKRIDRHRARRPENWETRETVDAVESVLPAGEAIVLIDCLSLLVSNWMLRSGLARDGESESVAGVLNRMDTLIENLRTGPWEVAVVTGEVGLGVVPAHELGRAYRDLLGECNQRLAAAADEVWLLVAGQPLQIKSGLRNLPDWWG
ncbi:MAG: bifunctional adenosylcobinamide kinase/adenosylcobinamide-phosphate guanylyltransferase [Solirubrobacterales bacterium]